jgi:hypothetical protein
MAGCGGAPQADRDSKRSGGSADEARADKGVKMRFTLPSDVQRAHKVEGREAGLALESWEIEKPTAGAPTACEPTQDGSKACRQPSAPDAPVACNDVPKSSIACSTPLGPDAPAQCEAVAQEEVACSSPLYPQPIGECEELADGSITCSSPGHPGEPTECFEHSDGSASCSGSAIGIAVEPDRPVIDSRIQISCLDEARPQPLVLASSMLARENGPYFDFGGAWWAAPVLRIGLEESGADFASFGIQEVPFFCQGDAAIEIVNLSPGVKYTIIADLFDFDATHLYTGSTASFGVEAGSVKAVQLHMKRVENPAVSVVVDVVFDEAQPQPPLPAPAPVATSAPTPAPDTAVSKPAKPSSAP